MIPKIIHYCWFGGNPLSELAKDCIASWKKHLPDYEIIEWNENNFDVTECEYTKEAYEAKKWAFVTDYVRLKVLVEYGGIYMDTDVEVIKPLDEFLETKGFSGFEDESHVPTGIMGGEKNFDFFKKMLMKYKDKHFVDENGNMDITTNTTSITQFCVEHGLQLNNKKQIIEGFVLYPNDFFCPKNPNTNKITITNNTYTIHHFAGSWSSPWTKIKKKVQRMIGNKLTERIIEIKKTIKNSHKE